MMDNIEYGQDRLKDVAEKGAREEEEETMEQKEEQTEDNINLTATENERALKGAYRGFLIHGILKVYIDGYVN